MEELLVGALCGLLVQIFLFWMNFLRLKIIKIFKILN